MEPQAAESVLEPVLPAPLSFARADGMEWLRGGGGWQRAQGGDGWACVHFGASVTEDEDAALLAAAKRCLAPGGRLLAPVKCSSTGEGEQRLVAYDKACVEDGGEAVQRVELMSTVVEPLRQLDTQLEQVSGGAAARAEAKAAIDAWVTSFKAENGRAPTRKEMLDDGEAAGLFARFQLLSKRQWS